MPAGTALKHGVNHSRVEMLIYHLLHSYWPRVSQPKGIMRHILFLILATLCIVSGGCATVVKAPLIDLHPGHRVEVINLGERVNTPGYDYGPVLDPDAISLYFSSGREGQSGVYRVDLNLDSPMPIASEPVQVFKTGFRDGNMAFSANGEKILFVSCDNGPTDCDIFEVLDFGSDEPKMIGLDNVNTRLWESSPALSSDGKTLYFAGLIHKSPELVDIDICVSWQGENGAWSAPLVVNSPVNSKYDDNSPYLAYGDSALFFSSMRPGGYGGYDLYVTFRQPDSSWGTVYNLGPSINTRADERSISMTRDGKIMFFASARQADGAMGDLDIYMARFVP